jgi:hypothetical protein
LDLGRGTWFLPNGLKVQMARYCSDHVAKERGDRPQGLRIRGSRADDPAEALADFDLDLVLNPVEEAPSHGPDAVRAYYERWERLTCATAR